MSVHTKWKMLRLRRLSVKGAGALPMSGPVIRVPHPREFFCCTYTGVGVGSEWSESMYETYPASTQNVTSDVPLFAISTSILSCDL